MARTVPGSGASIEPIFDEVFGVRAVRVVNGGSGYDPADPPRLTITGCGTPEVEALLYPIIDENSGKIIHVRVLERGRGYNPLRLKITPQQETPNIINSFDINRIWQNHPNSQTTSSFQIQNNDVTDRLRIVSDNHPKPSQNILSEREPGGSNLILDRNFDQVFVYRGGKDVPTQELREVQLDKSLGILANGGLLHTPDWGVDGGAPAGYHLDAVKYDYIKNTNEYDAVLDNNTYYYQTSKVINEFALSNGVFDWGHFRVFTWNIRVEFDNVMIPVADVDETIGSIEVGRIIDEIGGTGRAEISKIVRDELNRVIRIYARQVTGDPFSEDDLVLGSNGFQFRVADDILTFPNGIFYIDFGPEAEEFGPFVPGQFYFAPENIRVQRNYIILWNQEHSSNQPSDVHVNGHPMQFSTTPDGPLNQNPGTLYYNSTGASAAPATDYENEFAPLFLMNSDETNRIYYYCKFHNHMSGYLGDEGYMILDTVNIDPVPNTNTYYQDRYSYSGDQSRHPDGHSKILGMSFDGYPIYGPWGYNSSGAVARETSSYRLRLTEELPGSRPIVSDGGTSNYTVTISTGKFYIDGVLQNFLSLKRGNTYNFVQDDSSNDSLNILLFSETSNGWHDTADIGNVNFLYQDGVTYYLENVAVDYVTYINGYENAINRKVTIQVRADAPRILYAFSYASSSANLRLVQDGYLLGDLVEDYIYDSTVGSLDEFNGKFTRTPDYPNGTYAYFLTEDGSGNPVYPYGVGPKYYGDPLFEGDTVPDLVSVFPTESEGNVILNENGSISYIKMTKKGDNYFGPARAEILGGQGSGAVISPIVQTITGLSLLNSGRSYATPPTLIFEGGGGQGAQGAAAIDTLGKVTSISIVDDGEFYQEPPYVLITGGGGTGAKAVARIDQGSIVGIDVTDPGEGYTNPPNIIFTKLVNLKRKTRARQAFNSGAIYLTGLVRNITASDSEIYVDSTDAYPGSGQIIINTETITYTNKSVGRFSGLTRGVNFNYDQRVILDAGQNDAQGNSTYAFNVGDRVIRKVENANNKVAKVYDWNPSTRELLVTFEVDELAFIDGGIPSTEDAIVQFDAGVASSSGTGILPHTILNEVGSTISLLTVPLSTLQDRAFEDDDEQEGAGDGIPDLINTGTDYESQISLDGGIYNSLYGIEETQGGQNTTLFQVGDSIKDGSIPFKFANIVSAGGLSEGVEHTALLDIYLDANNGNGQNFTVNEVVTGAISGVTGVVVSWDPTISKLIVGNITPYNTGNVNIGIGGYLYEFSANGTVVDFIIHDPGTNYTAAPTLTIEDVGDIQAVGTVNMTAAGDQVASISITNGGYGIEQTVDGTYNLHPTVTFTNDPADTTGSGASAQVILGGETLSGNAGASYRIKRIEYSTTVRS